MNVPYIPHISFYSYGGSFNIEVQYLGVLVVYSPNPSTRSALTLVSLCFAIYKITKAAFLSVVPAARWAYQEITPSSIAPNEPLN